jgi:chemotaxis protein MotB
MAQVKGPVRAVVTRVRRKNRSHEEDGHGGAGWKIAYADFMTAMMAFFLVMWLISSMSPSQKKGIANYFDPVGVSQGASGVGGVLGGRSLVADGPLTSLSALDTISPPLGTDMDADDGAGAFAVVAHASEEAEDQALAQVQERFEEALAQNPALKDMVEMVEISQTVDGLKIDLVERYNHPMFARGSSTLTKEAQQLLDMVASLIKTLPNKLLITGHTDALSYAGAGFTNWELSSARALSTRQYLERIAPQIAVDGIVGKASTSLHVPDNPSSPLNRRITLLMLRQFGGAGEPHQAVTSEGTSGKGPEATNPSMAIQEIH